MTDRKGTVMPTTMTHRDQYDEGYKYGYEDGRSAGYTQGFKAGHKVGANHGRAEALAWMEDKEFMDLLKRAFYQLYRQHYGIRGSREDDEE